MLFQIHENEGYVVPAVVVRATLVGNLLCDLAEVAAFGTLLSNVLGELVLGVDEEEAVGAEDEEVVIVLNLLVITLRVRYYEVLVWHVADGATHADLAVHP